MASTLKRSRPLRGWAVPDKILHASKRDKSGCWVWQRSTIDGYGAIWHLDRMCYAHRVSYEVFVGEIADGYRVMHKCGCRACVNPDHLTLASRRVIRMMAPRKGYGYRRP